MSEGEGGTPSYDHLSDLETASEGASLEEGCNDDLLFLPVLPLSSLQKEIIQHQIVTYVLQANTCGYTSPYTQQKMCTATTCPSSTDGGTDRTK